MEPKAIDLEELAIVDPVAAYGLFLGVPQVPYTVSMTATFPANLNLTDSTQPNVDGTSSPVLPIIATLPADTIAQRTWIDNITYSLQCPNIFADNVFKTLFDAYLKQSPGISVYLEVLAGPKYRISQGKVPLENLVNLIRSDRWPAGWPIYKQQTIQGKFFLTQTPGNVPSLNGGRGSGFGPYSVTLTFNCWQFLDHTVDNMDATVCAQKLREAGVLCTRQVRC